MTLAQTAIGDLSYAEVVIGVVIAWVLVALWQRVVENTAYTSLGLDPKSAFHALLVAIVITIIFFVLISSVNSLAQGYLIGDTTDAPAPASQLSRTAIMAAEETAASRRQKNHKSSPSQKRARNERRRRLGGYY